MSLACPRFVPIVESNQANSSVAKKIVAQTLQPMTKNIDTLILGCTHYPLLRPIIQNVMGKEVVLIDSGVETVGEVSIADYFDIANSPENTTPTRQFYTTGSTQSFNQIAKNWLNIPDIQAKHIQL